MNIFHYVIAFEIKNQLREDPLLWTNTKHSINDDNERDQQQ